MREIGEKNVNNEEGGSEALDIRYGADGCPLVLRSLGILSVLGIVEK